MNRKYQYILFDLDHTLWDFEANSKVTLESLFEKYQLKNQFGKFEFFLEIYRKNNHKLWSEYGKGKISRQYLKKERFFRTLNEVNHANDTLAEMLSEDYVKESPRKTILIPGAREILEYLFPNYQMLIVTNGFNEVQFTKLKCSGLEDYFAKVVTSEMAGAPKPNSRFYQYTLEQIKASAQECIMIGDNFESDIMGAGKCGIDQIFFNPSREIVSEKPTYEIHQLMDINNIL